MAVLRLKCLCLFCKVGVEEAAYHAADWGTLCCAYQRITVDNRPTYLLVYLLLPSTTTGLQPYNLMRNDLGEGVVRPGEKIRTMGGRFLGLGGEGPIASCVPGCTPPPLRPFQIRDGLNVFFPKK